MRLHLICSSSPAREARLKMDQGEDDDLFIDEYHSEDDRDDYDGGHDGCLVVGFLCALPAQGLEVYIFEIIHIDSICAANNLGSICQWKIHVDIGYIMPATLGG